MRLPISLIFLFALIPTASPASAAVITSDTIWSGEVTLAKDLLVPEGVTLTITPGTRVLITPAESTKTEPEFLSPLTEITVRGTLIVNGKEGAPVTFSVLGEQKAAWAGIIIDGGRAILHFAVISDADTGAGILKGSLALSGTSLVKNKYGLVVYGPEASVTMTQSRIEENDYGVALLNGASLDAGGALIKGNRKKDIYTASAQDHRPGLREFAAEKRETARIYRDEALLGLTVWSNRIEVQGAVRVPGNSRLVILPGTVVEFSRKDTNSDGIGENGLLIQGAVIAKGTKEQPIVFRSAEGQPRMGDWDGINIMNSDTGQNLIEYCQIQDAYRGLHFHFSNVVVANSVLRNNYRGIQFQESAVEVRGTHFYGNKSGLQARDSDIVISDNLFYRNYSGINILRNSVVLSGNLILNNLQDGLRVREGVPVAQRNLIHGNRHGLMVTDAFFGSYESNVIAHNLESGMLLRGTQGIEVRGNVIQANGLNGMNIQDSSALIQGNLITDNEERGIGIVSFQGVITGNNIAGNKLYNLGIDGASDVSAPMNWWGGGDVRTAIFDKDDDPSKGRAVYLPMMEKPALVAWPLPAIQVNAVWRGDVLLNSGVSVQAGAALAVSPGTKVLFARGAGLEVKGKITARGEEGAMISFSGLEGKGPEEWGEILLDHATGSEFAGCRFSNATWALHSHFTDLRVTGCTFEDNTGGLRFTSGPITVRQSLFRRNDIGIRAFRGTALLTGNTITANKVGVFVREKGGGLTITGNNLFANADYNIRLGDFNVEDVNARGNWWGGGKPEDTIFDARREPGIGTVLLEPAEEGQLDIRVSGGKVPTPALRGGQAPLRGGDL